VRIDRCFLSSHYKRHIVLLSISGAVNMTYRFTHLWA
jgi:hypothetical protein